jgi:hypothetical protein
VIHLFLDQYREFYDIESLWSCGSQYDEKSLEFNIHQSSIEKRLLVPDEI